ncbi:hypothetical protein M9H77_30520 [Catharanthus roseus]|uniref:Uncharacterized protein n=1 Tax=Catharanthus roseus TaxID=4058 RepID=A0ACC0A1R4_CATRO|nr:hypothetical protein M9H77_30520 [Catharanthus roseus]
MDSIIGEDDVNRLDKQEHQGVVTRAKAKQLKSHEDQIEQDKFQGLNFDVQDFMGQYAKESTTDGRYRLTACGRRYSCCSLNSFYSNLLHWLLQVYSSSPWPSCFIPTGLFRS